MPAPGKEINPSGLEILLPGGGRPSVGLRRSIPRWRRIDIIDEKTEHRVNGSVSPYKTYQGFFIMFEDWVWCFPARTRVPRAYTSLLSAMSAAHSAELWLQKDGMSVFVVPDWEWHRYVMTSCAEGIFCSANAYPRLEIARMLTSALRNSNKALVADYLRGDENGEVTGGLSLYDPTSVVFALARTYMVAQGVYSPPTQAEYTKNARAMNQSFAAVFVDAGKSPVVGAMRRAMESFLTERVKRAEGMAKG